MGIEIERKFLVANEGWRDVYTKKQKLFDGLIAFNSEAKVRVRLYEKTATLTVKSRVVNQSRSEYEYAIPVEDATELLQKALRQCGAGKNLLLRAV